MFYDRGNHFEFTSVVRELAAAGALSSSQEYPFDFSGVDKQYESYSGLNVRLRSGQGCTTTSTSTNTKKEHHCH